MYQSELNQRSSRSRTCVLWDLSQGIGLVDCGDWLGKSHVHRASCQKGSCQAAVHRGNFSFFGKASAVLLRSFNWMNQAHWDYLKQSPLFKNPHALWMLITFTKYLHSNTYIVGKKKVKVFIAQLCPTLCSPRDCSPPGSSVRGNLQARILEWVAMPFSRESSLPRDWTLVSCITGGFFYHLSHHCFVKSLGTVIWPSWHTQKTITNCVLKPRLFLKRRAFRLKINK